MRFELNEYKGELSDDEILNDIRRVAQNLNTDYISISVYKKNGKHSQTAIQRHFGTWVHALELAGLRSKRTAEELKSISNEDYYADLRRVARLIGSDTVPYESYLQFGQYSCGHIFHRFGKWNTALANAGLKETGFSKEKISKQQCFDEIERMWITLGRQPTSTDITKGGLSAYSLDTFKRRFGGWRKALEAFIEYINNDKPDANFMPAANSDCLEQKEENQESVNERPNPSSQINDAAQNPTQIKTKSHRTSRNINARLRYKVLLRDNFKCCACGASPAKDPSVELHIDHIVPWSKGGETVIENLQTLCSKCNLGKGSDA